MCNTSYCLSHKSLPLLLPSSPSFPTTLSIIFTINGTELRTILAYYPWYTMTTRLIFGEGPKHWNSFDIEIKSQKSGLFNITMDGQS